MTRIRLTVLVLAAALAPAAARAGEAACWFEQGMVVVPASVAGIAGDYVLDTGSPRTQLHDTRAHGAGIAEPEIVADVRLAGLHLLRRPVVVADLDARIWNLPTPVAGVIGADVLKDFVLDVSFAPCRVRLSPPGRAPRFAAGRTLALAWDAGRPVTSATVSDGERSLEGQFVLATGLGVAARLADDLAQVPGAARPNELYPDGVWLARLGAVSFAGDMTMDAAAGLTKPEGDAAGVIGGPVLARYRLRFDFPAGRLMIAP